MLVQKQFNRIRAYTESLLPALVRCSFTCDGVSIVSVQRQTSCLHGVVAADTGILFTFVIAARCFNPSTRRECSKQIKCIMSAA